MCVFIQNQDVIKQTEGMLSVLSNSTAQAAKYMYDIQADLARRNAEVEAIGITLSQVRHGERCEVEEGIDDGRFPRCLIIKSPNLPGLCGSQGRKYAATIQVGLPL